ncbi:type II toxin-antitoxin system prevent-host-death family antitoxin [uncultured Candidatus Thioglobus sp.]|jgi:prevent-host-death family protein|uniref:type II toxin-antitoxin system Phd/YefM family antitoxin n=1 Tax=uncultured Candidatus Thioglobus sp. TaxID=655186 RepID=UPI0032B1C4F5
MLSIQSNEIKTHFSGVLKQVEQGQEFLITKHKKTIAKLMPYTTDVSNQAQAKQAVEAMKKLKTLKLSSAEISDYRHIGRR